MSSPKEITICDDNLTESAGDSPKTHRTTGRTLMTYESYIPSRSISVEYKESDPLIEKHSSGLSNTKLCLRTSYGVVNGSERTSCFHYLPVVFVIMLFCTVYGIFFIYYLKPYIQDDYSHLGVISNMTLFKIILVHLILMLFMWNYLSCIIIDPGYIPNTPEWRPNTSESANIVHILSETKKSGARRFCKWCSKYKPDRAHHCRICGKCVLKMDHHCPWVHNCIGWKNHKYFILSIFYASLLCIVIAFLSYPTVKQALNNAYVSIVFAIFIKLYRHNLVKFCC